MMVEAAVVTALATGVLGSAHCAVMCGPLAVAGCSRGATLSRGRVIGYFVGRAVSYATVGAVLGHLGRHALCVLPMGLLEGIAVALVAATAARRGILLLKERRQAERLVALRTRAKEPGVLASISALIPRHGTGLGLATGILPCGLLLPAWALAAGTASAAHGAAVMAAFSLATLPGLLAPLAGRQLLQRVVKRLPEGSYGVAWCALAIWVAARPLLAASGHCAP